MKKGTGLPLLERFWAKVDIREENDCRLWTEGKNAKGYGIFNAFGISIKSSRFAYEITKGQIPSGLAVCHSCDNPPCCNPGHLWLGTQIDNIKDREAKGRGGHGPGRRGSLTSDQVREIREDFARNKRRGICLELSAKYGIKLWNMRRIVRGETYKNA